MCCRGQISASGGTVNASHAQQATIEKTDVQNDIFSKLIEVFLNVLIPCNPKYNDSLTRAPFLKYQGNYIFIIYIYFFFIYVLYINYIFYTI